MWTPPRDDAESSPTDRRIIGSRLNGRIMVIGHTVHSNNNSTISDAGLGDSFTTTDLSTASPRFAASWASLLNQSEPAAAESQFGGRINSPQNFHSPLARRNIGTLHGSRGMAVKGVPRY